jgi:hypothetical protein
VFDAIEHCVGGASLNNSPHLGGRNGVGLYQAGSHKNMVPVALTSTSPELSADAGAVPKCSP